MLPWPLMPFLQGAHQNVLLDHNVALIVTAYAQGRPTVPGHTCALFAYLATCTETQQFSWHMFDIILLFM
jgi:hypothetical protein